jgi:hypothetical protein
MGASFDDMGRMPPTDGPLREEWLLRTFLELAPLPSAVPCAAGHARAVMDEWRLSRLREAAHVAVSALATSAVRVCAGVPGQPPLRLLLRGDGTRVLAVVHDASSLPPAGLDQRDLAEARLTLSAGQLAADWGWLPVSEGKLCWCLLR